MKLNGREREALHVMIDLFWKGNPKMRIAEYLFNKGFTKTQAYHFLNDKDKLGAVLDKDDKRDIYHYFLSVAAGDKMDWSRNCGQKLQNSIFKK